MGPTRRQVLGPLPSFSSSIARALPSIKSSAGWFTLSAPFSNHLPIMHILLAILLRFIHSHLFRHHCSSLFHFDFQHHLDCRYNLLTALPSPITGLYFVRFFILLDCCISFVNLRFGPMRPTKLWRRDGNMLHEIFRILHWRRMSQFPWFALKCYTKSSPPF